MFRAIQRYGVLSLLCLIFISKEWPSSCSKNAMLVHGFSASSTHLSNAGTRRRTTGRPIISSIIVPQMVVSGASDLLLGPPASLVDYSWLMSMADDGIRTMSFLDPILQNPVFWSMSIMMSIVALLYSWEKTITSARSSLPETLQPVVNSMLVEMGGLGFVGLLLGIVVVDGPLGVIIGQFSERFLGDFKLLWQSYQFLDSAFFEVAIAFLSLPVSPWPALSNKWSRLRWFPGLPLI